VLPLQLISCLTMFFRDRAELMKKANGTYFPEEVTMTFLVTFCDLYLFYSCMENIIY
jgi:hypothetical protein